ncbi:MAG: trigger factor [Candidatus Zixiibacteriota bacterium]
MKVEVKQGEGLKREISIELPAERVQTAIEQKFAEVQQSVTLKGFRKGHAPMNMVKSMYADEVKADVIDDLIKVSYPEALKEKTLNVASRPTLTNLNFTDDGGLVFTATVEVFPEVEKVLYDGFEVPNPEVEVKDDEVNDVIEYLRKRLATVRVVEREARDGDIVTCDLKKLLDPKLALQTDDFPNSEIDLGNKLTVKEFKENIPGMKAGDQKEIDVVYPDDYSDKVFAGAQIKYLCTVKLVKEQIMPEVDDAFAKSTGSGETVLELRIKVREDLMRQHTDMLHQNQKRELIRQVCEKNPIPIPEGMVEEYLKDVVEDFKKNYENVDEADVRATYHQVGVDSMRWDILWHKLAEQENVEVLPQDTENWLNGFAARNNITVDQAREMLNKSGRVANLRDSLLEEKVLEFLLGKASKLTVGK